MSTTKFTKTLIKVLEKTVKKASRGSELIQRIKTMKQTLFKLGDGRGSVTTRISTWKRLTFLNYTKAEWDAMGRDQRIRILKKELKSYREIFHSLVVNQFKRLCETHDDFRLFRIWDQLQEIKRKIDAISCHCDEGLGHVSGTHAAQAAVSTLEVQLQPFLNYPTDGSVDAAFIIEQVKGNLLGDCYLWVHDKQTFTFRVL